MPALAFLVASQLALTTLLFGTTYLERPRRPGPLAAWARRRRGELAGLRRHQQLLTSLGRASRRSLESLHR